MPERASFSPSVRCGRSRCDHDSNSQSTTIRTYRIRVPRPVLFVRGGRVIRGAPFFPPRSLGCRGCDSFLGKWSGHFASWPPLTHIAPSAATSNYNGRMRVRAASNQKCPEDCLLWTRSY
jgi:hypothetical protein